MRFRTALVCIVLGTAPALAESPSVYLFDVLRRPEYPQAYDRMMRGRSGLQAWFATARSAADGTTTPGKIVHVGGTEEELYTFCKPHDCARNTFSVLFSGFGQRAVGAVDIEGRVQLFGNPTEGERRILTSAVQQL